MVGVIVETSLSGHDGGALTEQGVNPSKVKSQTPVSQVANEVMSISVPSHLKYCFSL